MYKKRIIAFKHKKPKRPRKSEIDRLIKLEQNSYMKIILKRLKQFNKQAYIHMIKPGSRYGVKYKSMQKEPFWNEAKLLIKEYKSDLRCPLCKSNSTNDFILHHKKYEISEFFTPTFVQFVHYSCHKMHHRK